VGGRQLLPRRGGARLRHLDQLDPDGFRYKLTSTPV
jgi:hypothetical protein